jgi:hypothetical protein
MPRTLGRVGTRTREGRSSDHPQWDELVAYNRGMSRVTLYGVAALTFMMAMYWLEHRGPGFILGFALGCLLSSIYGFLAGAWPIRGCSKLSGV